MYRDCIPHFFVLHEWEMQVNHRQLQSLQHTLIFPNLLSFFQSVQILHRILLCAVQYLDCGDAHHTHADHSFLFLLARLHIYTDQSRLHREQFRFGSSRYSGQYKQVLANRQIKMLRIVLSLQHMVSVKQEYRVDGYFFITSIKRLSFGPNG